MPTSVTVILKAVDGMSIKLVVLDRASSLKFPEAEGSECKYSYELTVLRHGL